MQQIGKYIIGVAILLFIVGILLYFFGNKFNWFGNLPGDIRIKKDNFSFFMPISSMILVSIALSLVLWLLRKFF